MLNKNAKRNLNKLKKEFFFQIFKPFEIEYEDLAQLLKYREFDVLYDYLAEIANYHLIGNRDKFIKAVDTVVAKTNPTQIALFGRTLITKFQFSDSCFTYLLELTQLFLELECEYTAVGYDGDVVEKKVPSVFEFIMFAGSVADEFKVKCVATGDRVGSLDRTQLKQVANLVQMKYDDLTLVNEFISTLGFEQCIIQASIAGIVQSVFGLLGVGHTTFYDCLTWIREDTTEDICILTGRCIFNSLDESDIFKHRQKLYREKGTKIKLDTNYDYINFIELHEVHRDDEHLMVIEYETDEARRIFGFDLRRPETLASGVMYQVDCSVVMFVMWLLGLWDEMKEAVENTPMPDKDAKRRVKYMLEYIDSYESVVEPTKFHFEDPVSWNYKASLTSGSSGKSKQYRKVNAYVRRLPDGQKASGDRGLLAEKYCLELKDGYTLVDEYEVGKELAL